MNEENKITEATEIEQNSIWNQIGEMSLSEGVKAGWKYVLEIKLKYIAMGVGVCGGFVLVGLIIGYLFFPLLKLVGRFLGRGISMTIGMHECTSYALFDNDLFYTVPVCIGVAFIVGSFCKRNELLYALVYFVLLQATLEFWDYWFIEMHGDSGVAGEICFAIMFLLIPILVSMKKH